MGNSASIATMGLGLGLGQGSQGLGPGFGSLTTQGSSQSRGKLTAGIPPLHTPPTTTMPPLHTPPPIIIPRQHSTATASLG